MRLLITGLNGTLAPKVAAAARTRGWAVQGWDRAAVAPDDAAASQAFLDAQRPDAIVHLAMGAEAWAGRLAAHARERSIPMLCTSSAMVFHHQPDGPHAPADARTATDDYGRYKIRCEDSVRANNATACVLRIGWQIDADGRGNNMLAALDKAFADEGCIRASRLWLPACSLMSDTAQAVLDLVERPVAGVVHLDSNADDGWSFEAVVHALARRFDRPLWRVAANDDYRHDQRLVGSPGRMPPLSSRL